MAGSSNTGSSPDLERYMGLLADVRRAAILICDSIRAREAVAQQLAPGVPEPSAENAPRCPICMLEFKDPTVVISVCGHGMDKGCADGLMNVNGEERDEEHIFLCPLCRATFCRTDIVLLVGIMPSETEAAAWRTVQLTALWKQGEVSNSDMQSSGDFQDLIRRLYVLIHALFRNANDFSSAMGDILRRFEAALKYQEAVRKSAEEETSRLRDMETNITSDLQERKFDILRREKRLLHLEHQNGRFITKCVNAINREQWNNVSSLVCHQIQVKLGNAADDIGRTLENLDNTRKDLESARRLYSQSIVTVAPNLGTTVGLSSDQIHQRNQTATQTGNPTTFGRGDDGQNRTGLEVIGIDDSSQSNEDKGRANAPREDGSAAQRDPHCRRTVFKRARRNYRIE